MGERLLELLIVDDEAGIRMGLSRFFSTRGFAVSLAQDAEEAIAILDATELDAAVIDVRLKGRDSGTELLLEIRKRHPEIPVVLITGYGSVESAVEAIKLGASDYVLKPIDNECLLKSVMKNQELARLKRDNSWLKGELRANLYGHSLITRNARFKALIDLADSVKNSSAFAILSGESGTGKEVLARYIHFTSERKDGPFVGINCAALSEGLLLSELFGHERGSFTGAVEKQLGKFELADKGTLFLDEIGDMSLQVQSKLLRVLEDSSFERVGGSRRITVDIRVISATNKDLSAAIREGSFRSDLYYRINVVNIHLPPLRERREDIPLLVDFFVAKYSSKYNRPVKEVAPALLAEWTRYGWPGNVRELQNAVNQAVLLSSPDSAYLGSGRSLEREIECDEPEVDFLDGFSRLKDMSDSVVERYERAMIERALERSGWNRSETARVLGVTRKTLAKKMKDYGLERGLSVRSAARLAP